MVDSSNMDLVSVFLLILHFLPSGQSNVTVGSSVCLARCPRGYHKDHECVGPMENSTQLYTCKMCENDSFTTRDNFLDSCIRCSKCEHYQREKKPCTSTNDVECVCKDGYYNASPNPNTGLDCRPCLCKYCKGTDNPDYKLKCQPCQRCFNDPECTKKCVPAVPPKRTSPPTPSDSSVTTTTPRTIASNNTSNPSILPVPPNMNQMLWLVVFGVMVTFSVLFCLLLLLTKNPIRYPNCCLCWSANKNVQLPVEDPIFNEQHSHQGRRPTTLTLNILEEMPIMPLSQSPATPQHPEHSGPVLPGVEHRAARQDEQSEHWPAIVLYAIIKEVPLRRWKEFLRLLSVTDQHMERVELETSLGQGSMERQYQMLRLWSQRSSANMNDVFSALRYMDLSGCAQLLQENLEKLQWRPELKQGFTDHGFNGALQDT